jgi:hypothetical protein
MKKANSFLNGVIIKTSLAARDIIRVFAIYEWAFRIWSGDVAGDKFGHSTAPPLADIQIIT